MDRESYFNEDLRRHGGGGVGPGARRGDNDPSEGIKVRQLIESIRVRIFTVVLVWLLTVVVMVVHVWTQTPLYRSTATLEIEPKQNLLPYQDLSARGGDQSNIETQITLLRSGNLLAKVVERLELTTRPEFVRSVDRGFFLDAAEAGLDLIKNGFRPRRRGEALSEAGALRRLQENLSIAPVGNTQLVRVSYSSPDPDLSTDVAGAIALTFIETTLQTRYDATRRAVKFLEDQLAELENEIEDSQDQLLAFARSRDLDVDGESASSRRVGDLARLQTEAEAEAARLRSYVDTLRAGRTEGVPDTAKTQELRALEAQIARQEQELAALSARYGPEWPSVRQTRSELAELRRDLSAAGGRAADAVLQQYRAAQRRADSFAAQIRAERRSSDRESEAAVQLEILERKTQTNKQLYDGILQRLRETDIVAELQKEGIRISIPATRPNSQYAPNKTRSTLFALGIGLALGIAAALGLEFLDQTVKSSDHITESIGLPVLGTVPSIGKQEGNWLAAKLKLPRRKPSRTPPKLLEPKGDRRSNIVRESYRSVRTSLLLCSASGPPRTIQGTSALPAEGRSTTVANMAISFANNNARTLIIDLDLRKPALAPLFEVDSENGMSKFLAGRAEFADLLQQTKHKNLALVSAGPCPPNPTELLGSKRMRWCLGVASEHFDVVLIDSPPSLELSDALTVSPYVDGVVIVARAGQTPREAVRRTSLRFQRAGARILGALINGADLRNPDYGYYYSGYLSRTYDYHYAGTSADG